MMWFAIALLVFNGQDFQYYKPIAPNPFPTKQECVEWQQSSEGVVAKNDVQELFDDAVGKDGYGLTVVCEQRK